LEILHVNQKATKQLRTKCEEWPNKSLYITDNFSPFNPDRRRAVFGGGEQYDDDNDNENEQSVLLNN
jgi:hypothetical protein